MDIIDVAIARKFAGGSGGGSGDAKPEQSKTIEVTENGTYRITPDSGKVLYAATAKVNVPERYEEGYQNGYAEGYQKGQGDNEFVTEPLEVTKNGTYTPSEGVDGFEAVTVEVPERYDEGFAEGKEEGLSQGYANGFGAGVDSVKLQEKTVTENGDVLPDDGFAGMKKVTVAVPTGSSKEEQEKSITITENGTTEVTPDEGKTFSKVTIETNVSGGGGEVGKPYIDTSKMTSFTSFFANNKGLIEDLDKLDTSNGTNFGSMFYECQNLETIPLLNTSKGTSFGSMFYNCQNLESVPQLDTSNGTSFTSMFNNCLSLKTIPLLNTSKGTSFGSMFHTCSMLETVSLTIAKSDFSTNSFQNCTALTNLTIGEGWAVSIYLTYSNNLTVESLHGMIENLADLTGKTAKKFQVGATNLAKIDADHIAMLTAKNWNYS